MVIEERIEMDVSAKQVFDLYQDVAHWHCWDPDTQRAALHGPFCAGSVGRLVPTRGRAVSMELLSVVTNRSFVAVVRLPLCAMHFEHTLEPLPQGTRVTHRVRFSGLLAPLLFAWVGPRITRGVPATLLSLRHHVQLGLGQMAPPSNGGRVLVVLDLQNDFTQAQGKAPACVAEVARVFAPINALLASWQAAGAHAIVVRTQWGRRWMRWLTRGAVTPGSWGAQLDGRLLPGTATHVLKPGKSAFSGADFCQFLERTGATELVLCGLAAEHCVAATAKDAVQRGFKVVLVGDAVAAYRQGGEVQVLAQLRRQGVQTAAAAEVFAN